MTIRSDADFRGLAHVGRLVSDSLRHLEACVRPGITTGDLDEEARLFFTARGATSAPQRDYDFPGFVCLSVNDEIVHGIPGPRVIRAGDLVKIDVTAECGGYVADAAISVAVPPVSDLARRLIACTRAAFEAALPAIRTGQPIAGIGRAIEAVARRDGFHVVRELSGHGVGRKVHEPPEVPNYDEPLCRGLLKEGMVLAIEPIFAAGPGRAIEAHDRWTVRTQTGCLAAHHEHTLVVGRGAPHILTA
ncbi:MAG TPA: type I methionyl aminopeptidase [Candidatus Polarisedimenticolia bacterium]|nr:type I methionyl aminopeptidase [Candidatus Polarisedimenticolia bacterium]